METTDILARETNALVFDLYGTVVDMQGGLTQGGHAVVIHKQPAWLFMESEPENAVGRNTSLYFALRARLRASKYVPTHFSPFLPKSTTWRLLISLAQYCRPGFWLSAQAPRNVQIANLLGEILETVLAEARARTGLDVI